jgi:regulator of protease activity HflC (stomatin/prohibitin superfamily)
LLALFCLVGYFLKDFFGIPYHLAGSYVWGASFLVALTAGLFYRTQFILPLRASESWFEGLRLVISHHFPELHEVLRLLFRRPRPPAASDKVKERLPAGFLAHRAGHIDSHLVLGLRRGMAFTRPAGPGFVRLTTGEQVADVVDIRPHWRQLPAKARTRDGISIDTSVSVTFQVQQPEDPSDQEAQNLPYRYDPAAIFKVTYLDNFSTGDGTLAWTERVTRQAVGAVVAALSRKKLDELFQPDASGAPPLESIKGEIKKQLEKTFSQHGLTILGVGIGALNISEDIKKQRISNWEADWQRRITLQKASGEAEAQRRIQLARARAQIEIIESVINSVETMRKASGRQQTLTDIFALRMIETMEETATDATVKAIVPQHVMATMRQIHRWLEEGQL